MAWIEFHQGLGRHHKMRRIKRSLGIGVAQAVGHMALLWTWAIDAAPDGDLTNFECVDIAEQAEWDGDPLEFVGALVSAGLLDQENERLTIHDWDTYAGRLVEKRRTDAERKRMSRGRPTDIHGTAPVTVPNRTVPDHVHVGSTAAAADVHVPPAPAPQESDDQADHEPLPFEAGPTEESADAALEAKSEALVKVPAGRAPSPAPKPRDTYPAEFEAFWQQYPRRVVKDAAALSWKRALATGTTPDEIRAGLVRWLGSVDWRDAELKHLPHATTWLNQRRWRDEPEQVAKPPALAAVAVLPDGRPDDLAWEREYLRPLYPSDDTESVDILLSRARAVQKVVLDRGEVLDVLRERGLDDAMRWIRGAVAHGVREREAIARG